MYKKINGYIATIGLCTFVASTIGMDIQVALKQSLYKNITPTLAINDYIVNTENSYQAFKKETSLVYDNLKRSKFNEINHLIRLSKKFPLNYRRAIENSYIEATRDTRFPSFMSVQLVYKKSDEYAYLLNARLLIKQYIYNIYNFLNFKSIQCSQQEYIVKNIDTNPHSIGPSDDQPWAWLASLLQKKIRSKHKRSYLIELYSDKNISDWVTVHYEKSS